MQFLWRHGAVILVFLAGIGVVLVTQSTDRRTTPRSEVWSDETTGSLGPNARGRMTQELPLTDEERARIHARIIGMRGAPTADVPPPELLNALPASVPLHDLPSDMGREIPLVQGYKFVKLDDRILLVSPATRVVVSEIPRYKLVIQ